MLIVRAIFAVLFGVLELTWPGLSLLIFIYLFGIFALADGLVTVIVSIARHSDMQYWWVHLLGGIISIIIGLIAFFWPGLIALTLLFVFATWAIIRGIAQIAFVFTFGGTFAQEWLIAFSGVISLLLGIFLFLRPGAGILSLVWLIGIYAIVYGVLLFIRAFQPCQRFPLTILRQEMR